MPEIGVALTLLFAGGAAGKLVCGFLGARLGVLPTVLDHRRRHRRRYPGASSAAVRRGAGAAAGYRRRAQRHVVRALRHRARSGAGGAPLDAFGVFYTGTIGAGALSPALYGLFGDAIGISGSDAARRCRRSADPAAGVAVAPRS